MLAPLPLRGVCLVWPRRDAARAPLLWHLTARGSPGCAETAPRWQGFGGEGAGPQEGRGLRSGEVGEFSTLRDSPAPPTGRSLLLQKLPPWVMSRCGLELGKPQSISDSPR